MINWLSAGTSLPVEIKKARRWSGHQRHNDHTKFRKNNSAASIL
jgi:hypothetical protein